MGWVGKFFPPARAGRPARPRFSGGMTGCVGLRRCHAGLGQGGLKRPEDINTLGQPARLLFVADRAMAAYLDAGVGDVR